MQDDFTVFRCNNERARALFYDLLERAERGAYDDDFLAQLAAYREEAADAVHADILRSVPRARRHGAFLPLHTGSWGMQRRLRYSRPMRIASPRRPCPPGQQS